MAKLTGGLMLVVESVKTILSHHQGDFAHFCGTDAKLSRVVLRKIMFKRAEARAYQYGYDYGYGQPEKGSRKNKRSKKN
ncbi:MAG: hypothetical protein ACKORF_04610 [Micrococcales bacterium]